MKKSKVIAKDACDIENCGLINRLIFPTTSRNCFCFSTPIIARSESMNAECKLEYPQMIMYNSNLHRMMFVKLMMYSRYTTREGLQSEAPEIYSLNW